MRNLEAITSLFLLWFYCSACCCLAHISSPGRWKSLWNNKTEHSQLIPSLSNRDNIIVIIRYSAGVHAVTAGWNTPGCFLRRHMEHYTDRQPQQAHYTHTHTHTHTLRYWKRSDSSWMDQHVGLYELHLPQPAAAPECWTDFCRLISTHCSVDVFRPTD